MEKIDGSSSGTGPVKVAIVGPESTGKTTLARQLASHFHARWVPEYAREYLDRLGCPYKEDDLLSIAKGQVASEERIGKTATGLLICDTNLLVLKVWSDYKYGRCSDYIVDQIETNRYDLHLLTGVDVPWTADPQRENPADRSELYLIYQRELRAFQLPFLEIKGGSNERLETAINAINHLI